MCVVSMIGDHYSDKWSDRPWYPQTSPWPQDVDRTPAPYIPRSNPLPTPLIFQVPVTRDEFNALLKEVEEMRDLLVRAKAYDAKNNEPNCEMESKVKLLRAVAEAVGVDLRDVFHADTPPTPPIPSERPSPSAREQTN